MNKTSFSVMCRAILPLATTAAMLVAQYFIWVYAPEEMTMGLVQKIFYIHLPLAWWALVCFAGVFAGSIMVLVRNNHPAWDAFAAACAEVGVLLCGLALVTGSLWARSAWNTWWTWDPRLSTALVMWFVYAGYLILRGSGLGGASSTRICAVLGIIAFLDVPLVFFSARMWRSIHPAVFASQSGGLEPEMLVTVFVSLAAWGLLTLTLVLARWRIVRYQALMDEITLLGH
ncbi:cytochrome c biogenesis protein [Desulfoplanes formicivorans]|uniref:cytochrome c biogenesis protein n=1 Tax=Desulfoplanes formicivorans TaxID=1592317 RepID=UPI003F75A25A